MTGAIISYVNSISKPIEGKGGIYGGAASEKPIVNLFVYSEDMRNLTKGIWCSDNTLFPKWRVKVSHII